MTGFWGTILPCAALLSVLAAAPVAGGETDSKPLRDGLVGTWTLVSTVDIRKDGSEVDRWGVNPKGTCLAPSACTSDLVVH